MILQFLALTTTCLFLSFSYPTLIGFCRLALAKCSLLQVGQVPVLIPSLTLIFISMFSCFLEGGLRVEVLTKVDWQAFWLIFKSNQPLRPCETYPLIPATCLTAFSSKGNDVEFRKSSFQHKICRVVDSQLRSSYQVSLLH